MNVHTADTDGIHGIQAGFILWHVLDVKGILTQERKIIKREVMMNGSINEPMHYAHQHNNGDARRHKVRVNYPSLTEGA